MPYGSRLRKTMRRTARRARRSAVWSRINTPKRYTRSLAFRTKKPFGFNPNDTLHVDRPVPGRGFMPAILFTTLRYSETVSLSNQNISGLVGEEMAYRLNSLYDPNFTLGFTLPGHQPLGFDQLTPMYRKYTVYRVDVQVKVTGVRPNAATDRPFLVAAVRSSQNTWFTTNKLAWEVQEQPHCTILDGNFIQTWDQSYNIADIEGKSKQLIFDNPEYSAGVGANPSAPVFFTVACGEYNSAPNQTVQALVSIVYHARFTEPNMVTYS